MPISLAVKLTNPLDVSLLLPKIGRTLQEILGLTIAPLIEVEEYVNRRWLPLRSKMLTTESNIIGFKIVGESEITPVIAHNRGIEHSSGQNRGDFAVVDVAGERTPLAFAIAAAVAIAIGRECGSEIADDMPYFTPTFDQSADDFINAIRVRDKFNDYHIAAQEFHKLTYAERDSYLKQI